MIKKIKTARRFDSLRFKVYRRFCRRCDRIFSTPARKGKICRECSPRRSREVYI